MATASWTSPRERFDPYVSVLAGTGTGGFGQSRLFGGYASHRLSRET
jgi:hypothetical protein